MLPSMSEQAFPPHAPRIVPAAILHHLLARHPAGDRPENISRALFGPVPSPAASLHLVRAVAALRRDGLVEVHGGLVRATAAARAFHAIMGGGRP